MLFRSRSQRSSTPPDYAAIKTLKESVSVPVLANGDVYSAEDVTDIVAVTGVDGLMSARGMMENPSLFTGGDVTTVECVQHFLRHAVRCPIPFPLVLHHVGEMTLRMPGMSKAERKRLMACQDMIDLIDYVEEKWRR